MGSFCLGSLTESDASNAVFVKHAELCEVRQALGFDSPGPGGTKSASSGTSICIYIYTH